jgi:hypothetical protein
MMNARYCQLFRSRRVVSVGFNPTPVAVRSVYTAESLLNQIDIMALPGFVLYA